MPLAIQKDTGRRVRGGRRWLWISLVVAASAIVGGICWRMKAWPDHSVAKPAKPLGYQVKLVKSIAAESTEQSIARFSKTDDVVWASGTFSDLLFEFDYKYQHRLIPRLVRVRKVLQEGRSNPQAVIPLLQKKLEDSLPDFEKEYEAHDREVRRAANLGRPYVEDHEPGWGPKHSRKMIDAQASVYLLAELRSYSSLPLLARTYRITGRLPVSRIFLFYAMHLLASDHPRDRLSPAATRALDEYLRAASAVPPPRTVNVAAWNAELTETDFRVLIAREDIGLDRQPQVSLRLYPYELGKYEDIAGNRIGPQLDRWFNALSPFIDLAYPHPAE